VPFDLTSALLLTARFIAALLVACLTVSALFRLSYWLVDRRYAAQGGPRFFQDRSFWRVLCLMFERRSWVHVGAAAKSRAPQAASAGCAEGESAVQLTPTYDVNRPELVQLVHESAEARDAARR
jgi:hypothetical protein